MTAMLPRTAPFSADEIATLNTLVGRASPLQRSWLSGFLAGVDAADGNAAAPSAAAAPPRAKEKLTILYGSETGNAESLALKARKAAQKAGFDARILDMADASVATIAAVKSLVVIASTWGEGDPPQRAAQFMKALLADAAPRLDGVCFEVLALGDTAYANFSSSSSPLAAGVKSTCTILAAMDAASAGCSLASAASVQTAAGLAKSRSRSTRSAMRVAPSAASRSSWRRMRPAGATRRAMPSA